MIIHNACNKWNNKIHVPNHTPVTPVIVFQRIEDQSFHINHTIRNPASISLPVRPCCAAATPEPMLVKLYHLCMTHGCHPKSWPRMNSSSMVFIILHVYIYIYSIYCL